jgi:hypothetical protein
MFKAVPYIQEVHYPVALTWWKAHGWTHAYPAENLPPVGIVVELDDKPVAMAWLYQTDAALAWMFWLVSDRYADKEVRNKAIDHLIDAMELAAKKLGYKELWINTNIRRMEKRLSDHKYLPNDRNTTFYMKGL